MADDGAKLVVSMEARLRGFERQLQRAGVIADKSARDIEKRLSSINPGADALIGSFKRIGAAAAAAFSIDQVRQAIDSYTKVQNALKVAGLEGDKLRQTYEQLFAISQRQGTSIESTATLYGRLAASQKELGVGSNDLLKFTEGVGTALRVAGSDATAASGALLQLGQALGGGKIQAEEFNSILDGARPVLQAVANGLVEAGGSVAKLTALVKDGQVSSQAFFRAFLAGIPELERQAEKAGSTSSQAFERIQNSLINLAGEIDKAGKVSDTLASGLISVAGAIDTVANAIPRGVAALREYINLQNQVLNGNTLGGQAGKLIAGQANGNGFRTGETFGGEPPAPITGSEGRIGRGLSRQAPVSLKQFPVVGEKKGGGGGGGGGGAVSQSEFEREVQQIQRRTALLTQEATTVGKSAFEADRARAAYDLMEAAKRAGLSTTPALTAQIDQLSQAYAQSEQTVRAAEEAQRSMNELAQFAGDSISGFFSDIVSGGENAEKALMNLVKRLADAALQAALLGDGPLAGLFGGKAAGGGVGGLIGTLFKAIPGFAGGTRSAPGGLAVVGERGPELVNLPKGSQVIPNDVMMGGRGGGSSPVVVNISATNNGGMSPAELAAFGRTIRDAAISGTFEAIRRGR
jgi:tape measure domain-containing protein